MNMEVLRENSSESITAKPKKFIREPIKPTNIYKRCADSNNKVGSGVSLKD
jgi:hypothetical protein